MSSNFLIITLAMNGYQWVYRSYIKTHSDYAKRIGANYITVSKPSFTLLGVECCWLKLHILKQALMSGYNDVLILDADAWVNSHCPDIRENAEKDKYIYMVKGYSKRFNSGVLWVRNHPASISFISKVINNRLTTIPLEDDVGWGENGHIIHHAKSCDVITELDISWNNTFASNICDYIRHYNHGPLRSRWYTRLLHKVLARSSRAVFKVIQVCCLVKEQQLPSSWFTAEMNKILKLYPNLLKQE